MQRLGWTGRMCALMVLAGLVCGCYTKQQYNTLLDHNRRLTAILNETEQERDRLKAELAQVQGSLATTQKFAESLDADARALREALERSKQLTSQLEGQLKGLEGVTVEGGKVRLEGEVFFDSGKATIKKSAEATLTKVGQVLKQSGVALRIDGHTDSQPIQKSGWKSNHDLAAARALAVFNFFRDEGISEDKMHIVAYGPNKPKASNDTAEGRRQNRRVEILLLSGVPTATPPPKGAPAPAPKKPAAPAPAPTTKPKT